MEGHMKRNSIKILTAILALMFLFSGCINPEKEEEDTTTSVDMNNVNPSSIGSYQTTQYQYLTNVDVSILTTNLDKTYLILANKTTPLGETYEPASLTTLTCATTQRMELETRAAQALYAMLDEMTVAGVSDISVTSAYRSYSRQHEVYNGWVIYETERISEDAIRVFGIEYIEANYYNKEIYGLSLEDAQTVAQSYSALPGQSEHQTGLCVDFITSEMGGKLTEDFENTVAFEWLSKNAYKFGFILRYPKDKESITGYTYEPWHYRFVGREAATDIYNGDMTFEQYLQLTSN